MTLFLFFLASSGHLRRRSVLEQLVNFAIEVLMMDWVFISFCSVEHVFGVEVFRIDD